MKYWKQAILFYLGGCAYIGLELLWRGRSHSSMFVAGGVCFVLIGHLNRITPRLPLLPRAVVGAGIVTMVELAVGLISNRNYEVWDYRDRAFNFLGQICPAFSLLWIPVSLLAFALHRHLYRQVDSAALTPCVYF